MSDAITRDDAASRYERTVDAQPDIAWALDLETEPARSSTFRGPRGMPATE